MKGKGEDEREREGGENGEDEREREGGWRRRRGDMGRMKGGRRGREGKDERERWGWEGIRGGGEEDQLVRMKGKRGGWETEEDMMGIKEKGRTEGGRRGKREKLRNEWME
ncbi:hypothetical protein Pcinc_023539 [Petrolisthes cinctipes]|uniref:Uncharacterized protein n=1 Tax=Petrolisthes cinctipes TaxID=88211 RepID=A0AAE1FCS0_PETCI|nr:hypothetical protein Pcinc_023539 [Petrolisthes cinctipes]